MVESEQPGTTARCRSCAAPLHGPYCSICGESHVHGRLELRELASHAIERLRRAETPALRTMGDLSVAPARVCADYLDGRRRCYVNPVCYALVSVGFAFAVAHLIVGLDAGVEPSALAGYTAYAMGWGQLLNLLAMPLMALLLVPLMAGAPRELRWVEHLVVVLYGLGHVALIHGLLSPLMPHFGALGRAAMILLPFAYMGWIAVGVYGGRWWSTALRVIAVICALSLASAALVRFLAPGLLPGL